MVFFRDTGGFLPYVTKIWLYVTPVLYFVREIPPKLLVYLRWNPLYPSFAALEQIFDGALAVAGVPARRRRRGRSGSSSSERSCSSRGSVTLPSDSDRPPAVRVDDLWVSFRVTREKNQTLKGTLARHARPLEAVDADRGAARRELRGAGRLGLRRDRPQRRGQVDDAAHDRRASCRRPPGRVAVWGRVTPLLSLGVGFNRELTGRENILLGGLTAGLTVGRGVRRTSTRSRSSPASATRSTSRCARTRRACSAGSRSRSPRTSSPRSS